MENVQQGTMSRLRTFIIECKRVLTVTKKPDQFEFKTIAKAAGLGIVIIGMIGFIISIIKQLLL